MVDKTSIAIAVIAIIISASSVAYTASLSGQISNVSNQLSGQITQLREQQAKELAEAKKTAEQSAQELEKLKAESTAIEAAKKEAAEGPLVIYGSMDAPDFLNIVWPRFQQRYPWVGPGNYIEGFTSLMQRFQEEAKRGVRTADVRMDSGVRPYNDLKADLLKAYTTEFDTLYEKTQIAGDGRLHQSGGNVGLIAYNSDLVKEEEAPKCWTDLADPKWQGEIITGDPRTGGAPQGNWANVWSGLGDQKFKQLIKGVFVDNKAVHNDRWGTTQYLGVLSGEFKLATTYINDIVQQDPKAPVKVVAPCEGVSLEPSYVSIYKNTPKPNLAKLYASWLVSPEGQRAFGATGRTPALFTVESPSAVGNLLPGAKILPLNTEALGDPAGWREKFKTLFTELGIP